MHSVIEGMDRLLTRTEANGRKVRRLEDRSTEIGVIVDLIRGISSRTDMLALNATIESIRAGEHGRGFAVIAEEIRKLAERTAGATREISTLVEAIQSDAQESIQALGEEQAQMQGESERLRETGSSLERISQVAERSARLVEGISRSTRDQVLTTQDLVRAMQRISEVTHQTEERTTQARAFIRALKQSCEPWQRLAATDPIPDSVGWPMGVGLRPSEGSPLSWIREHGLRSGLWIGAARPRVRLHAARSAAPGNRERAIAMKPLSPPPLTASSLADRLDALAGVWQNVATDVAARPIPTSELDTLRDGLHGLAEEAEADGHGGLAPALRRIALLSEVWECLDSEPDRPEAAAELAEFCLDAMRRLAGYSWVGRRQGRRPSRRGDPPPVGRALGQLPGPTRSDRCRPVCSPMSRTRSRNPRSKTTILPRSMRGPCSVS